MSGTPVVRRELVDQGVQGTLLIHVRPIVLHRTIGRTMSRFPLRPPGRRRVSELGQPLTTGKRPLIEISHRMSTLMTGQPASSRRAQRTGWREIAELPQ